VGIGEKPAEVRRRSDSFEIGLGNLYLTTSSLGYLYTAFASQTDYEYVLKYAKELDVVLWENAAKRCFFSTLEGHANIRGFIERYRDG
jgi:hypothetical protein